MPFTKKKMLTAFFSWSMIVTGKKEKILSANQLMQLLLALQRAKLEGRRSIHVAEDGRWDARGEYRFDSGPFSALRGSYGHADYTHTEFEAVGEPTLIDLCGLARRVRDAVYRDSVKERFLKAGMEPVGSTSDELDASLYAAASKAATKATSGSE